MPDFWFLPLKGPSGCKLDRETDRDGKRYFDKLTTWSTEKQKLSVQAHEETDGYTHSFTVAVCHFSVSEESFIQQTYFPLTIHQIDMFSCTNGAWTHGHTHAHTRFWQVNLAEEEWWGGNVGRNKLITAWWREITSENEGNGWKKCSSWPINTQNHNLHPKRSHFINVWVWVFIFIPLFTGCVCVGNANNFK